MQMMPKKKVKAAIHRIWELDFLRGVALLYMLYFHTIFDLSEFYNLPITYATGINHYLGIAAGSLFILVSGISCSLSRNNLIRGAKILMIALIITVATYLYDRDLMIKFGILHFFGVSILLYPVFNKMPKAALALTGLLLLLLGPVVSSLSPSYDYLFPLGIISNRFSSGDYYPLIPWMGVFIIGILLGKILYIKKKKSIFPFSLGANPISFVGRHTLWIYLLHQQAILLLLKIVFRK